MAGLGLGMASVSYIEALLYGVKTTHPSILLVPTTISLLTALLVAVPAVRRAVKIDAAVMLRAE